MTTQSHDSAGTRRDLLKKQCELGRKWLNQGRIEGMIFLASNVCDLELETMKWTRKWIQTTA